MKLNMTGPVPLEHAPRHRGVAHAFNQMGIQVQNMKNNDIQSIVILDFGDDLFVVVVVVAANVGIPNQLISNPL